MPVPERARAASARGIDGEGARRSAAGRGRRADVWAAAVVAATALAATLFWQPRPLLVWNASASSPPGLYRLFHAGRPRPGAMAVAWPPARMRALAADRHYLPANVPLVKRVAAVPGDRVCAAGDRVLVNGRFAGRRRDRDLAGRRLPWWSGCRRLGEGELFLLGTAGPNSFDGRYFGVTEARLVVGEARLIWPR